MTLRIETSANRKSVTFALSGRLDAMGLVELQRLFDDHNEGESFILDLKDVQLVDRSAVKFLASCKSGGMQLENCPAYIRDWISREEHRSD
jgi:ABC-type transporter Mla MlaB component